MLMTPNPRLVSEKLLARGDPQNFKSATIVNLLAAAWIQFQVHDWAQHFKSDDKTYQISLSKGDTWSEDPMTILQTQRDSPLDETDRTYPAYRNENTHW
jgi:Animal haem peroxidase